MDNIGEVQRIMDAFAERTGLSSARQPPRRYLWTDAFAVCNFLELFRLSGRDDDLDRALQLVNQVHHVLGRHRPDDDRTGWISGLSETEGERHPTRGGLRIGKRLPERRPEQSYDERLEWERDGQYFHYLTKWMHALNRATIYSGVPTYNNWALELAQAVHGRFTALSRPGRPSRMCWKMSIDLTRPLVASMGHLDPLDAYITYSRLRATAATQERTWSGPDLSAEISDAAAMCAGQHWATDDALGIGGLLASACELAHLGLEEPRHATLLATILKDAADSLPSCLQSRFSDRPAEARLAFRELGLSIGLHGVGSLLALTEQWGPSTATTAIIRPLHALTQYLPLIDVIERFWRNPVNQQCDSWRSHEDINSVMLATSLSPHAYLTPAAPDIAGTHG
jgi:hypothetical protein